MRLSPEFPLLAAVLTVLAALAAPAAPAGAASPAAPAAEKAGLAVPFLQGKPFAELLKRARAQKKPLMIDMYAVWCGPCKLMDRTTFSDKAVADWAKQNVIPVKIDAEKGEGRKLAQRYMVTSFPTVLFVDGNGREIDRLVAAYPPQPFLAEAAAVVAGSSPLQSGLRALQKNWSPEVAAQAAIILAQRRDTARLRPLVVRYVTEDAGTSSPDTALQLLTMLAALEDVEGRLDPETADLVATFLTRVGGDPRRGALAIFLGREQVRRGETAAAKKTATSTLAALGDPSPYAPELWAVIGAAEKKAGKTDAALAAYRRAAALSDAAGIPPSAKGEKRMALAEVLADVGKADEARAALTSALEEWPNDPEAWTRAAGVELVLKAPPKAVEYARRAVALSQGEDAGAQAALGAALGAAGDVKGAAAAWKRAAELEPDNAAYRRSASAARPPAKAS
jgi:tetratricopeptide (TPR) repeat protein